MTAAARGAMREQVLDEDDQREQEHPGAGEHHEFVQAGMD
jgi:hypothetical protein